MKGKRHTPEQIIKKLREAELMLATAKAASLGAVAVGVVKDDDLGGRFHIGDILTHAEDIIEAADFPKNPVLVDDCGR